MRLKYALALAAVGTYCIINPPFVIADAAQTPILPPHATGQHVFEAGEEATTETETERSGIKIGEFAAFSGIIEVDAIFGEDFEGDTSSSIDLATVELYLDLVATEWAKSRFTVEYDGDEDDIALTEANITLGNDAFPLFLTAGRVYAPFGEFSTNMLQDPLTLTVGEINTTGVVAGFTAVGIKGTIFGFKGLDETSSADTLQGIGASLGYAYEENETAFNAGISWVNNIADSDAISEVMSESGLDGIISRVDGFAVHLGAKYGAFSLIGEYLVAVDRFDPVVLAFGEKGAKPAALNSELACTVELWAKETVFAVGYQQSIESLALGLPEQRLIAAASMEVFTDTTVSLEYYLDQDYAVSDGGTDEDGYGFTTRLAYVF